MRRKAKQQPEQKTGLIITLVFFILTTIGLGYATYTGYAAHEGMDAKIKDAQNKHAQAEKDRAWFKFQSLLYLNYIGKLNADNVEELKTNKPNLDSIGAGQADLDRVKKLIAQIEQPKEVPDEQDPTKTKMVPMGSYDGLLIHWAKAFEKGQEERKRLQAALDQKTLEEAKARADADQYKADYLTKLKELEDKVTKNFDLNLTKPIDDLRTENQNLLAKLDQVTKEKAGEVKVLQDQLAVKDNELIDLQKRLNQRNSEVAQLRQRTTTVPKDMKTDWRVVRIVESTPYINLGSLDKVTPQLTFTIHGLDAQGKPLAEPKATLEVINVMQDHLSQARLTSVKDPARDPVLEGDVIFNPSWDPNRSSHVVLAGLIDIDGDGVQDLEEVKRHLKRQNVIVDAWIDPRDYSIQGQPGRVTIQTDYLILGNGSEAITNVRDRLEAGRALDENIGKLKDQGKEYGVETISISRYLKNIGFGY